MRAIIRSFDNWLSAVQDVHPISSDPLAILRIQNGRAAWNIPLPDSTIPVQSELLILHLFNDRLPAIPAEGPDMAWAFHTQRLLLFSFRLIGHYLQATPSLVNVRAVGGYTAQIRLDGFDGGRLMLEHLGFTLFPYHRPTGAFGEFWENFYSWWLMWTYNPASLRCRKLLRLQRTEFWMTKDSFLRWFGDR